MNVNTDLTRSWTDPKSHHHVYTNYQAIWRISLKTMIMRDEAKLRKILHNKRGHINLQCTREL